MKGVLFFVCLGFLLLRGSDYVSVHHDRICNPPAQHFQKTEQAPVINIIHCCSFIEDNSLHKEENVFISEDNEEDEDTHTGFSRKNKSLNRYDFSIPGISHSTCFFNCTKDRLAFCGSMPDKCIAQRTLRI